VSGAIMMRKTILLVFPLLLLFAACLPNPDGPVLAAPGAPPSEFLSNFASIQINGDFSGTSWEPSDPRHDLVLEADHRWAIWVSVMESDMADGEIHFKFTHDASWSPDNFGAGSEAGDLVLQSGDPPHCIVPMDGAAGFYKIWMDDEAMRYSTELAPASGGIEGSLSFDGPDPPSASVQLRANHPEGDAELWSADASGGQYGFANLADSLFTVIASASGYGSLSRQVRVSGGQVATLDLDFGPPLDSVEPDQPWATPVIDGVLEGDWRTIYDDDGFQGLYALVHMDYDSLSTAWDGDSLYLAVSGDFTGTFNSLNIYIDADYGAGSGLTDLSLIHGADEYVDVVSRLKKQVDFAALPGFGAELATTTWGHADPELSALAFDGEATPLGRGAIAVGEHALELAIPWAVLYPELGGEGAVPPFAQVAVFCLIGSNSETAMSDDSLPHVDSVGAPDSVLVIPVDQDGE